MKLLIKSLLILGIFFGFLNSYDIPKRNSFAECRLSNWRITKDVHLDYATNVCCHWAYSHRWCAYMRQGEHAEFLQRLERGDTLIVSFDYYILTGISSMYFQVDQSTAEYLLDGNVIVLQISKNFQRRIL